MPPNDPNQTNSAGGTVGNTQTNYNSGGGSGTTTGARGATGPGGEKSVTGSSGKSTSGYGSNTTSTNKGSTMGGQKSSTGQRGPTGPDGSKAMTGSTAGGGGKSGFGGNTTSNSPGGQKSSTPNSTGPRGPTGPGGEPKSPSQVSPGTGIKGTGPRGPLGPGGQASTPSQIKPPAPVAAPGKTNLGGGPTTTTVPSADPRRRQTAFANPTVPIQPRVMMQTVGTPYQKQLAEEARRRASELANTTTIGPEAYTPAAYREPKNAPAKQTYARVPQESMLSDAGRRLSIPGAEPVDLRGPTTTGQTIGGVVAGNRVGLTNPTSGVSYATPSTSYPADQRFTESGVPASRQPGVSWRPGDVTTSNDIAGAVPSGPRGLPGARPSDLTRAPAAPGRGVTVPSAPPAPANPSRGVTVPSAPPPAFKYDPRLNDPGVFGAPGGVPGRATGQTILDYEDDLQTFRPAGSQRYAEGLKTATPSVPLNGVNNGPLTPSTNVEDLTQDPGVAPVPGGIAGRGKARYQTIPKDVVQGYDPVSGKFDYRGVPVDPDAPANPSRGITRPGAPPAAAPGKTDLATGPRGLPGAQPSDLSAIRDTGYRSPPAPTTPEGRAALRTAITASRNPALARSLAGDIPPGEVLGGPRPGFEAGPDPYANYNTPGPGGFTPGDRVTSITPDYSSLPPGYDMGEIQRTASMDPRLVSDVPGRTIDVPGGGRIPGYSNDPVYSPGLPDGYDTSELQRTAAVDFGPPPVSPVDVGGATNHLTGGVPLDSDPDVMSAPDEGTFDPGDPPDDGGNLYSGGANIPDIDQSGAGGGYTAPGDGGDSPILYDEAGNPVPSTPGEGGGGTDGGTDGGGTPPAPPVPGIENLMPWDVATYMELRSIYAASGLDYTPEQFMDEYYDTRALANPSIDLPDRPSPATTELAMQYAAQEPTVGINPADELIAA